VKILKLNKNKKVDQNTLADSMKSSGSMSMNRNKSNANAEPSKTESKCTLFNKNRSSCAEEKSRVDVVSSNENQIETTVVQTVNTEIAKTKAEPTVLCKNIMKSKSESALSNKSKKVETTSHISKTKFESTDLKSRVIKNKK